ncbi:MAG: NAD-glutamate dehydrogenase [Maricaulaceae bacterium]
MDGAPLHGADGGLSGPATSFLEQFFADIDTDEVTDLDLHDVVAIAAQAWEQTAVREPGRTLTRFFAVDGAGGRSLNREALVVVTEDRPFLVDSIMGEVNDQRLNAMALFHPIVVLGRQPDGRRDPQARPLRESMIIVHFQSLDTARRARLEAGVAATLADHAAAVDDWADMRAEMDQAVNALNEAPTPAPLDEVEEAVAFLRWLRDDNFAFLGCRHYEFAYDDHGRIRPEEDSILRSEGLGVLRDPSRYVLRNQSEPIFLTPTLRSFLKEAAPLIVAKSNLRSRVHRRVYMDYVGVKRYRADGEVMGESRFVGLFTAEAYDRMAREVPLIRRKVRRVMERAGKAPGSHNAKKLRHIVETYHRDELFQCEEDDLLRIGLGVLHLLDRPRPKLFVRRDRFERFIVVLAYVPRERYGTGIRSRFGDILEAAYGGRITAFYPTFGDQPLARVVYYLALDPEDRKTPDFEALEQALINLTLTWEDQFESAASASSADVIRQAWPTYQGGFSAAYREAFTAEQALDDLEGLERVRQGAPFAVRAYRLATDPVNAIRMKLYVPRTRAALSSVLPIFENMGLHVKSETGYRVRPDAQTEAAPDLWVHDFDMTANAGVKDAQAALAAFEAAVLAIMEGRTENDGFNRLILTVGAPWRDVAFLRACARWRQQTGMDASERVQIDALADNAKIVRLILDLARTRFDPALDLDASARRVQADAVSQEITAALEGVERLDADRVLRRLARLVLAIQRTNLYQTDAEGRFKAHIALKIAVREIEEAPDPKPYREIFVWAPHVEGVHLRFGPVARGGLRWSDRRDDFRQEVLGLVKAQQVKNAVIVPVGSKGGFYPKQLPKAGDRDAVRQEAIRAYKTFISGLLDLTDNLVEGRVAAPPNTVCWDGEDPYLVVAADKGTATFSDIANGVAQDYGFWLGDAFASGGSAGYDHKGMGITARGAWEAVKRHFRELGKDIQSEPFTVIGCGDMSGDVFGNGMLLSRQTRLIAAFDHRDIFIDQDPQDLEASWNERKRLFDLGRSSWEDYDRALISTGGGVFSRAAKSVALTPEIRALTGLTVERATPSELIRALVAAPCELLWFGGIGTYVKSADEQHWQVSDTANDAHRVDAGEVRAKVIGEGANLGVTHAGRVALGRRGVKINADFVDNAAGVATSDQEVNLKILLNGAIASGDLVADARDELLASMTEDVAQAVLRAIYDQTMAISIAEHDAVVDLDAHSRVMERLEKDGQLDRAVEGLPDEADLRQLKKQNLGLTRTEIAVLVSYAKITLFDELVASSVPDDPYFAGALRRYFPQAVERFETARAEHRLRREIIATRLANRIVDLGGPAFVHRAMESTGEGAAAIARGFAVAYETFGVADVLEAVNALDNKAPSAVQIALYKDVMRLLRRQAEWHARQDPEGEDAASIVYRITRYADGLAQIDERVLDWISDQERRKVAERAAAFEAGGAPTALSFQVAKLRPLAAATDLIDLASARDWPLNGAGPVYYAVGARFGFERLRAAAEHLHATMHWDRLAARRLVEDFYAAQYAIADGALRLADTCASGRPDADAQPDPAWADQILGVWITRNGVHAQKASDLLEALERSGDWTLAKLAIANTQLRELANIGGR